MPVLQQMSALAYEGPALKGKSAVLPLLTGTLFFDPVP
jgi:hypothetical protein